MFKVKMDPRLWKRAISLLGTLRRWKAGKLPSVPVLRLLPAMLFRGPHIVGTRLWIIMIWCAGVLYPIREGWPTRESADTFEADLTPRALTQNLQKAWK